MAELGVHLKPSAYQLDVRPLLREACSKVRECPPRPDARAPAP